MCKGHKYVTHLERWASEAIKDGQIQTKRSASPESERHVQVMSHCVYSCLSLISILRGNLTRLCRLKQVHLTGRKVVCLYVLFQSGPVLVFKCGFFGFQGKQ